MDSKFQKDLWQFFSKDTQNHVKTGSSELYMQKIFPNLIYQTFHITQSTEKFLNTLI